MMTSAMAAVVLAMLPSFPAGFTARPSTSGTVAQAPQRQAAARDDPRAAGLPAARARARADAGYSVDADFAGGNIVVDAIAGDRVSLHQDLRDFGPGNWFYWNFRVSGAGGRTLTFDFTHPWGNGREALNVIGVRGPAVSLDGGRTWRWLGAKAVRGTSFTYRFASADNDVRFSNGMPYVGAQFDAFLQAYRRHPHLEVNALALTREGRRVERVHVGQLDGKAKYRVVVTARHHASEMVASYVLEGLIRFLVEDPVDGAWFREHGEALILPFMDKDGVENGEQGKGRRGRDHNRDYSGASIYPETAALKAYVPVWAGGRPLVGIDLHNPWIRGHVHEVIQQVGNRDPAIWQQQVRFGKALQAATARSAITYSPTEDLPYGTSWNTADSLAIGDSFQSWLPSIKGTKLATVLEIPFANASGAEMTQTKARAFGADLARALVHYIRELDTD